MSRTLPEKLDLGDYLQSFSSFLARPKPVAMEGDIHQHYRFLRALGTVEIPEPPKMPELEDRLMRLSKQAVLGLEEIFDFVRMLRYINRLRALGLPEPAGSWIAEIDVPDEVAEIGSYFTDEGELNPEREPELLDISEALRRNREAIRETLYSMTRSERLRDYLVDQQLHLQNGEETLLVRGGFSSVLKATVVGRSAGGFFYVLPEKVRSLKERESELLSRREAIHWRYAREFSAVLHRWERFLRYLDRQFDRFDHYQARVRFARSRDYEFVLPDKGREVILREFAHPALENPVPISIDVGKPIVLVTGVNAGGKTMLLKSILSAVWMSKYLLPFRCKASETRIGHYKRIEAIIDDPQSVKNDISTFAGRMLEFSRLFRERDALVGIDEIELGTDADEAASLFRVLLEELRKREMTFVVTTHHKRLASLMAGEEEVELVAALYDEERRRPTYTFLQGSIGKSYAFETAERYGIPRNIVERAREYFGEDKERLNELIEQSTRLEAEMRRKIEELERSTEELRRKERALSEAEEKMREEQRKVLATLENRYNAATKRALAALKKAENAEARQLLNEAHRHKSRARVKEKETPLPQLKVGDRVKYRSHSAEILSMKEKEAMISVDGMKMRVPLKELRPAPLTPKIKKPKAKSGGSVRVEKSDRATLHIKLLGMRAEEAEEALDAFLSNALLHGIGEVEIIHGTGTGVLARVVSEYLKRHPRVKNFYRMPGNMGATIAEL
ncbi:endonuclease MutS2 [Nitratifractor sp.]|uniref:endonuclease MutS2 n=1 Tax=Nitratifractor sp. TaxID=2268144 RepID=UPI0025E00439|nr:endonuclease MutS2 [Nitratifractor sp.]